MSWNERELIAVSASRLLEDRKVVFAGVGTPLLACALAKLLHAPRLTIVLEGGIIDPNIIPGLLPISTNEMRGAYGARKVTSIVDIFLYGQRGFFDYGFLGAAQVDEFGNVNTSVVGEYARPKVRLPGGGGANDISSSCGQVFVATTHDRRRFVDRVDFITSPGWLDGGRSREESGLGFGGVSRVVTDLAIMGFDETARRMTLLELQPGVTVDQVQNSTGFELTISSAVREAKRPSAKELSALRRLDPDQILVG